MCGYGALGFGRDGIESLSPKRIDGLTAIVKVFATTDYAAAISGRLIVLSHYYILQCLGMILICSSCYVRIINI